MSANTINRRRLLGTAGTSALLWAVGGTGPARAGEPFRIGALNPITGAGSLYGTGMQKAIIFSAEEVNAAGGAGGRMLEVFPEDSQTQPDAGVLAAKRLIEVKKVHAIMGTWSSGVALAVMPIQEAAGVIHMTSAGASIISTQDKKDLVYRFSTTGQRSGRAIAKILAQDGVQRVATMAFNNASGRDITDGVKGAWTEMGRKLVAEVVYEPNRPSYRSELQRVLAGKPEAIVLGAYVPDTTIIVREAWQLNAKVRFIGPGYAVSPKLVESLGPEVAEGLMAVDYVSALNGAAFTHFAERYRKVVGGDPADGFFAACAYDMVQAAALAIEAAGGSTDNAAIAAKLREVANPPGTPVSSFAEGKALLKAGQKVNYEGASGPLDFDEHGDVRPLFKLSVIRKGQLEFRQMLDLK
ncbi:ABC transporter substrate-binding protein [Vineibacter terrae]|uniref:ABC transporter substrate-binding protein n=1 Tax=Vineibacter terrae TaxID=2586908 RepID=UPI002E31FECA|nr:ABC transporter substrate-binding protein [Vineibacter terrae]HEX2887286.1 ABC transporter substrate-binding protein [Vineibacter terrae]